MSEGLIILKRINAKEFPVPNSSPFHQNVIGFILSRVSTVSTTDCSWVTNPKPFKNLTHYYPWPRNQVRTIMESLLLLQEISLQWLTWLDDNWEFSSVNGWDDISTCTPLTVCVLRVTSLATTKKEMQYYYLLLKEVVSLLVRTSLFRELAA